MIVPWLRRLPFLRVYPALQEARDHLGEARQKIRALKDELGVAKTEVRTFRTENSSLKTELDRLNGLVKQRDLALHTLATADLHTLVAPMADEERLTRLVREDAETYRRAHPFPHIVVDDLFSSQLLERVLEEFESMDRGGWHRSDASHERKWSTEDVRQLGPFTSALIAQLNGGSFVRVLEELTGIAGLLPDPHLRGGGLHEIRQGGLLGVHADFNIHPRLKVYRRLNLLIYLNKDWQPTWGGALELWDRSGKQCVREIQPIFGRAVLFDTSNFSYHGHPHPLACPPERSRKSVALYYYSAEYPFEEDRAEHGTIFLDRAEARP